MYTKRNAMTQYSKKKKNTEKILHTISFVLEEQGRKGYIFLLTHMKIRQIAQTDTQTDRWIYNKEEWLTVEIDGKAGSDKGFLLYIFKKNLFEAWE